MPAVRFAASVDTQPPHKRRRDNHDDDDDENDNEASKRTRPNQDYADDEMGDVDIDPELQAVPSEKELLETKRKRMSRRNDLGEDGDGRTRIDDRTSLAAEGIAIEPFHMRNEESDGAGFFDGDTYVFRKKNVEEGDEEEPDAWLDRLREDEENGATSNYQIPSQNPEERDRPAQEAVDDFSMGQLYEKIVPLLNNTETLTQALIRYGRQIKPNKAATNADTALTTQAHDAARSCLNELTGAANALLLKGEVDIYQTTKVQIQSRLVSSLDARSNANEKQRTSDKERPAKWEYRGSQDGHIHGPYTTEQMFDWTKAGYFVGQQRVMIRTIREEVEEGSLKDDLLADLLDDEADTESNSEPIALKKGDWMWSNEVNFKAYSPNTSE